MVTNFRFFIGILVILSAGWVQAVESSFAIAKKSDGTIHIKGECEKIGKVLEALKVWKQKLGEPSVASRENSMTIFPSADMCSEEISHALPAFVAQNLQSDVWAGPNCWNTVLLANKIINSQRFSNGDEFSNWMQSPLCRQIKSTQGLPPGAIGAIRDQNGQDHHAFIYLTEDLVFEKKGPSASEVYQLVDQQTSLLDYRDRLESGKFRIDFYDCKTFAQFEASSANAFAKEHRALMNSVQELSKSLGPWTHVDKNLNSAKRKQFERQIGQLQASIDQMESKNSAPSQNKHSWFFTQMREELRSLETQLLLMPEN